MGRAICVLRSAIAYLCNEKCDRFILSQENLKGGRREDGRRERHRTNKVEVSPPNPTPPSSPSSSSPPRCQVGKPDGISRCDSIHPS
ncbi:hypothetical protein [Argonema antarcticum]|uniref:hypothetical protein n=1 Tax=Argonema antarcticum TaxID=2942763 RepID=UPI002013BA69|nr:hypothetical protein [Argonema antarcticum]MCL1469844.1 hypothetical protein [Argonema antarcticum A004/B2]